MTAMSRKLRDHGLRLVADSGRGRTMSADNVTPIRPGSEPPDTPIEVPATPEDVLTESLRQARAIVDLIHFCDRDSLYDDTMDNALWAVDRFLNEAQEAADKLCRKKAPPA
jgi:hypothetical protein